jgi:hypothetical protein
MYRILQLIPAHNFLQKILTRFSKLLKELRSESPTHVCQINKALAQNNYLLVSFDRKAMCSLMIKGVARQEGLITITAEESSSCLDAVKS